MRHLQGHSNAESIVYERRNFRNRGMNGTTIYRRGRSVHCLIGNETKSRPKERVNSML